MPEHEAPGESTDGGADVPAWALPPVVASRFDPIPYVSPVEPTRPRRTWGRAVALTLGMVLLTWIPAALLMLMWLVSAVFSAMSPEDSGYDGPSTLAFWAVALLGPAVAIVTAFFTAPLRENESPFVPVIGLALGCCAVALLIAAFFIAAFGGDPLGLVL
jgi:hypothetical protein